MWARREGDFKSLLTSFTPEFVENTQKTLGDKFEDGLKSELPGNVDWISDFRILKKELISDNEVKLTYMLEEAPHPVGPTSGRQAKSTIGCVTTVKRVGGEWKLAP